MLLLLNEPTLWIDDEIKRVTKQYYVDAYNVARWPWGVEGGNKTDWIILIHDAWQPLQWWGDILQGPQCEKVWIDHHHYQAYDDSDYNISAEEHIRVSPNTAKTTALI